MIKALIAVVAFVAGSAITTNRKDKEILRLQKRVAYLGSLERITKIHKSGYDMGILHGRQRLRLEQTIGAVLN